MDRGWLTLPRLSLGFKSGLENFLESAVRSNGMNGYILCPCSICCNRSPRLRAEVYEHIIVNGMDPTYMAASWVFHGDDFIADRSISPSTSNENGRTFAQDLLGDIFADEFIGGNTEGVASPLHPEPTEGRTPDAERFYNLVAEADKELYPGCTTYKKLEFIVELYQLKTLNGMSDKCFSDLLVILRKAFPEGETLPKSFYHAKKLIGTLGLSYEKIHACPNDCMLYWQETIELASCRKCGTSRWKDPSKKVLAKVFRYFPLGLRLQRLYMSKHTAEHMRWHDTSRTKDGALRHPADSAAWTSLNDRHPVIQTLAMSPAMYVWV